MTPQDLGFLKKVITVNENIPTIQSFRTIAENNVTAVAVVNNEGTLVGNLSASDLKVITILTQLFLDLIKFQTKW